MTQHRRVPHGALETRVALEVADRYLLNTSMIVLERDSRRHRRSRAESGESGQSSESTRVARLGRLLKMTGKVRGNGMESQAKGEILTEFSMNLV